MMSFFDLHGQTANMGHFWGPFSCLVALGVGTETGSCLGHRQDLWVGQRSGLGK